MDEDETLINQKKKKHPLENANILSKLFFCWLLPYFVKGYKRELNEYDLYGALECHESARLGDKLEAAWENQVTNREKKPSLLAALLKVFHVELAAYGVLYLVQEFIVKLSQPLLISKFLKFYDPNQRNPSTTDTYIYAGLIVLFALLNVMCVHNYYFYVMHLGMKIRVATSSLIYRKTLKLNKSALAETTVGQMVNLLTNDVGRFDFAVQYIHNLWIAPIETAVIMYLLYVNVGATGLTGVCFLILFIIPQMYMGQKISQFRSRTAKCTDERVRLMGEIINGIQVIKMYTWEKSFAKLIEISRKLEMKQIWATSIIRAIMITCITVLHRSAIYLCVLTYILTGNIINATYVYTIASFYSILRQAITMFLPRAVSQFAETRISLQRIQKYLLHDEVLQSNLNNNCIQVDEKGKEALKDQECGVHLENVSVKLKLPENVLDNVTFDASPGQLVAIVGRVGAGKTTLLNTILKEFIPVEGSVHVEGKISYVSQEPWLFEGSIKRNIIFGEKFNSEKYDRVLKACDLEKDLRAFPHGDQTLIGDLSGGQKARVNLARAVYVDADVYLLDDPLSAVDARVGKHLFDKCICEYLQKKCVVLVTNQLQYLKNIDNIYLIEKGRIEAEGSFDELKMTGNKFTELLVESKDDEGDKVEEETKSEVKETKDNGKPVQDREQRGSGKISKRVYKSYLQAGGSWVKTCLVFSAFVFAQIFAILSDYFVIVWVNLEQWKSENQMRANITTTTPFNVTLIKEEAIKNGTTNDSSTKSIQGVLDLILTENSSLIIYSVLIALSVILALTRSTYFFKYCITASTKLHNLMFGNIIKAPMRFFSTNPPGRILNRFSKDIGTIDETLPMTVADTLQIALILLSISVVVGCLYPWVLLPTVVIVVIFYYIRLVFLATSRDLKRIEAVTRSPIYTHLRSSVQGLTTIRAFGSQDLLRREFDRYQDQYTAASFLFLGANRTFGFWLDLHCVIYTACVVLSILFIKSEIFGGNVGFALTEAVGLTGMFQWGIRQWSEMENQMTSVERIQEYIEEATEKDEAVEDPPRLWPKEGGIKFDNLCLRYSPRDPYVLNDLTFEVKPKEKIGIVGRTGAGKSSIIFALFRLTDTDGDILIDDVNIKQIPLATLRSKISIIPQEPVLFSGTVRDNLDPFGDFRDEVIWKALENVELKTTITDLPQSLNTKISEGGSNFSVGQRQLICLARAIIRSNRILVLDEATANVDPYTDNIIQETIRREFADCTVLTIAHRLHTIMDSDRVLVMDDGRVVEYAHPYELLRDPEGCFYGLVSQTGKATADLLTEKAEQYYNESFKE